MEAKAVSKYLRISPRKTRLIVDLIRGRKATESLQLLKVMNKKAAGVTAKTLNSAIANARQKELEIDALWIKKATVDGGPAYKRYLPRAMGRATLIRRPTSHLTLVLSDEGVKGKPQVVTTAAESKGRKIFRKKPKTTAVRPGPAKGQAKGKGQKAKVKAKKQNPQAKDTK